MSERRWTVGAMCAIVWSSLDGSIGRANRFHEANHVHCSVDFARSVNASRWCSSGLVMSAELRLAAMVCIPCLGAVGCMTNELRGPEEGPCEGTIVDARADEDDLVGGTTARQVAEAASGTRRAAFARNDTLETDVFTWEFSVRRTEILELVGGPSIFDNGSECPPGPAMRLTVRATLSTEAGFEGRGEGTLWFADGRTWIGVAGDLTAWPPATQLTFDGLCGTSPRFGSYADIGAPGVHWEGLPAGSFTKSGAGCGDTAFRWSHPE